MDSFDIFEKFNELYEKFYSPVRAYFSRRVSAEEAEDLTQLTFMKLWGCLPGINAVRNERALIFSIAKNVCCDFLRRRKIDSYCEENMQNYEQVNPEDFTAEVELKMVIHSLPQKDRELIELKRLGWSSREIAKVQGISASAVRSRFQRLRMQLGDFLTYK